jgi:hypothetical protein
MAEEEEAPVDEAGAQLEEEEAREEGAEEAPGEKDSGQEEKKIAARSAGGQEAQERSIASRGIPSKESLYLPAHNSSELRAFQDGNENITRNAWNLEEVVNFVFPSRYQQKYHEVALNFLRLLVERTQLNGEEIGSFVSAHGISKATFYNRVLPRLRRIGMVKVERQTLIALESRRKFRPMTIALSKTFGNYLTKIGDSWLAIVDDARSKKK